MLAVFRPPPLLLRASQSNFPSKLSPIYGKIRVKRVGDLIRVVILTATFTHASNSS